MIFAAQPTQADQPAPSDQADVAPAESEPTDAVPDMAAGQGPEPVVPDKQPGDAGGTDAAAVAQETAASEPRSAYQGGQVDGEALAELHIAGLDGRDTLETWLASGVVALSLETPNGTIVGIIPAERTAREFRYRDIAFIRPDSWQAEEAVDPRSNMRIRYDTTPPVRITTLELYLANAIGVARIDSVTVSFTNRAAAGIKALQDGVLASAAGLDNPAALRLFLCFVDGEAQLDRAELRETGAVLESPGKCGAAGKTF